MKNNISSPRCSDMQELREQVQKRFLASAWPTGKDEEWRRSDPDAMPWKNLEQNVQAVLAAPDATQKERSSLSEDEASLQDTLKASILSHAQAEKFNYLDVSEIQGASLNLLEQAMEHSLDRVDMWRLLQMKIGAIIVVPDETKIDAPIEITISGNDADKIYAPVLICILGKNSSLNVQMEVKGDGMFLPALFSSVQERACLQTANFQSASLDSISVSTHFTLCQEDAKVLQTDVQFGSMIANSRTYARIDGTRADLRLNGAYFASEDQLIDTRTYQSHIAEDSYSRVIYYGVASGESHTVYRGLIDVDYHAKGTDAYLTNKNLLLSEDARMDSIPCLNINMNEVRCSHGSTTGTLDPFQLFYLQSRGMTEEEARDLLVESFIESVLDPSFAQLNERVLKLLQEKIRNL